ncbi:hypothetical protein HYPSUDRAFT_598519 [Hypholoma sublateritium FD-334 SS-4]|uniref:Uncharacterized protein n=1 Tax=Hypholoma sublateritium (strain FD-334 SS-4) TaxID=945553 RepID=A0A0D2P3Q8_HYPSF|nr:hypothetical protein HYPSUDRAFT_598519 [Hypholoma sublateritium FD-334 SS-4]
MRRVGVALTTSGGPDTTVRRVHTHRRSQRPWERLTGCAVRTPSRSPTPRPAPCPCAPLASPATCPRVSNMHALDLAPVEGQRVNMPQKRSHLAQLRDPRRSSNIGRSAVCLGSL